MNKELFASMREQMSPGGEARAALAEKLAAPRIKRIPAGRYAALAACAAAAVAAVPVYGALQNHLKWQAIADNFQPLDTAEATAPHSYVLADGPACWPEDSAAATTGNSLAAGIGDEDQGMTSGELTDNLLESGFAQEDIDAYLASGWQMTWAKWWKFYHLSEESGDRTLEALLDFSQSEGLAANTGEAPVEMPGGAYVGGAPVQENAVRAYQNLMARFEADCGPEKYPEWYGGAYISGNSDCLVVNIVEALDSGDKEFYLQVQDWAGSGSVAFGSCKYSLNYLRDLQTEAFDAMCGLGLAVSCGIDEEAGQLEMTLCPVTDEALALLARLDPEDDAIHLIAVRQNTVPTEAPAVTCTVLPGGDLDGNPDGYDHAGWDSAIAYEPQG